MGPSPSARMVPRRSAPATIATDRASSSSASSARSTSTSHAMSRVSSAAMPAMPPPESAASLSDRCSANARSRVSFFAARSRYSRELTIDTAACPASAVNTDTAVSVKSVGVRLPP